MLNWTYKQIVWLLTEAVGSTSLCGRTVQNLLYCCVLESVLVVGGCTRGYETKGLLNQINDLTEASRCLFGPTAHTIAC